MPTIVERKKISEAYLKQANFRSHNEILFDIFEGDLAKYVLTDLANQLSKQAFDSASQRISPINVLKRIVDKQSKIYNKPPTRIITDGTDQDMGMLSEYERCFDVNATMQLANELFNLHKSVAIEPYLKNNKPKIRTIPADRFVVMSLDPIEPNKMTHFAKIMGSYEQSGHKKVILHCYSDREFWVQDQDGEILWDHMQEMMNPEGINPFGVVPFVYINRSKHDLIPKIDSDTLTMTKLIPVLLSDLNYSVLYQCFSIIYGVDVDDENLKMAPNAFWRLKSDPSSDKKPEVGVLKPQVDIAQVVDFISSQLAMWLQTKGIRPGSIGKATAENFSSGISKTIDEMDTSEDRQAQTHYFQNAEEQLWEMVTKNLHPVWSQTPNYYIPGTFSPNVEVQVIFPEQRSDVSMQQTVDDEIKKLQNKLTTRKLAIMRLNPDMSEAEIEDLLRDIEEESIARIQVAEPGLLPDVKSPIDSIEPQSNQPDFGEMNGDETSS